MPKVNKKYFEEKENQIVDAAIRVCKTKPAYEITMRDVVRECDISQGGIYNYFSDIDEIFSAILNRCYSELTFAEDAVRIFDREENPEIIIETAFDLLGKMTDKMIKLYGNLIYELNAIYLNNPARGEKAQKLVKVSNDNDVFLSKLLIFIDKHIANGSFNPAMPKEHIMLLISVAFQGITRIVTFTQNVKAIQDVYGVAEEYTTAHGMASILSQAVIAILNNKSSKGELK